MTEPTDAEIWQMWMPMVRRMGVADPVEFARAVLAKWGTPAPVGVEPIGVVGYTVHGTQYVNWLSKAPAHGTPIYTTPQPTRAQAGAVPLTDEQMDSALGSAKKVRAGYVGWVTDQRREWGRAVERAHGIKGDQHGTDN